VVFDARNLNVTTTQSVSWLYDLHNRELLDLDPPYQRRSVWNQKYKDYFIDTVLLGYPTPPIFLHRKMEADGTERFSVVDGKQRITTVFEFISNQYPVGEIAKKHSLRGKYFKDLSDEEKKAVWSYQFLVYYVPDDDSILSDIFDRFNRNVAKLSPQELRHARFDGDFITAAEDLASWTFETLPQNLPNIAQSSRRQMKDIELVSQLLLLIEQGSPKSFSQDELDKAFAERDDNWENKTSITKQYRDTIQLLADIVAQQEEVSKTRLRNQADFYSLFGAVHQLVHIDQEDLDPAESASRLKSFIAIVEDEGSRAQHPMAQEYYDAVRSASNDETPRKKRIQIVKEVLRGTVEGC